MIEPKSTFDGSSKTIVIVQVTVPPIASIQDGDSEYPRTRSEHMAYARMWYRGPHVRFKLWEAMLALKRVGADQ